MMYSSHSPAQTLHEIETRLAPVSTERLRQIISRLMLHFPCPPGDKQHRLFAEYSDTLKDFPEDLVCAAYQHVLKHHQLSTLPRIADLLAFMEPEMSHRRRQHQALLYQMERVEA